MDLDRVNLSDAEEKVATADFRNTMQEWDYRHLAKYSVDMAAEEVDIVC